MVLSVPYVLKNIKASTKELFMRYGFGINVGFLFIFIIPLWLLARIIFSLIKKGKGKVINLKHEIALSVFVIYVIIVIGYTLFPIVIRFGERFIYYQDFINYIPIISLIKIWAIDILLRNVFGNIALFIPMGVFLPILWDKFRSLKKCLLMAAILSFAIEIFQCIENILAISNMRICDIDDIILNSIGAIIGYFIFKLLYKLYNGLVHKEAVI